jgi:hypothetical protein
MHYIVGSEDGKQRWEARSCFICTDHPFWLLLDIEEGFHLSSAQLLLRKSLHSYASINWMFVRFFSACAPQGHQMKKWLCESFRNYLQKSLKSDPTTAILRTPSVAPRVLASIAAT